MRINLHDFSGHPFQIELSRELGRRGHFVHHVYCDQYVSGHGRMGGESFDGGGELRVTALSAKFPFEKYAAGKRLKFELGYARAWTNFLDDHEFDVVVSCNVPLFAMSVSELYLRRRGVPWLLWHQDLYSEAIVDALNEKLGRWSFIPASAVRGLEKSLVRRADQVVAISREFPSRYQRWRLPLSHVTVIPNWAPLSDIRLADRENTWSRTNCAGVNLRLMYSGTLGRKHNPFLLLHILDEVKRNGCEASLIVCSEGTGADQLRDAARDRSDVLILGFQSAEDFSDVLGSADVLIALLEPEASQFSVPSKVLTYLAAGRAVVGLMPTDNPAAADIVEAGGFIAAPNELGAILAGRWIAERTNSRLDFGQLGERARSLAEHRFAIDRIADKFERLLQRAGSQRPSGVRNEEE